MNQEETHRVPAEVGERWLADPPADVIGAGDLEGRRGVLLRLGNGEPSTVWFRVGERTLRGEAFILPAPPVGSREEVFRRSLAHNPAGSRLHLALDRPGELVAVVGSPGARWTPASSSCPWEKRMRPWRRCAPPWPGGPSSAKRTPERLVDRACAQTPVDCGGYVDRSPTHPLPGREPRQVRRTG